MGEVWAARNERTNREVAVKFLLADLARNPEAMHRFVREAKATGQLRHPNIVSALDAGMHQGRPYLVLELLDGESLEQRLSREKRLDPVQTCVIGAQIGRALAHAHKMGIVHRDLSLANVFLTHGVPDGPPLVKVLDFGVSRVISGTLTEPLKTGHGAVLGSPGSMSPEQAAGAENAEPASDLWSLGVLMYQCLAGVQPFHAANTNALMQAIIHAPHEPLQSRVPELDPGLAELVEGCLIKDHRLRFDSAKEFARQLEAVAIRLCRSDRQSRYLPLRRTIDRALYEDAGLESRWIQRLALPSEVLPLGSRIWRKMRGLPAAALLGAGIALGVSVGVAATKLLAPVEGFDTTWFSLAPWCGDLPSPAVNRTPVSLPLPSPAASAAARETDLVRAMARGLEVPMSEADELATLMESRPVTGR